MSNDVVEYEGRSASDDAVSNAVQALASGKQTVFSTIAGDDFASKLKVLEATTKSAPIADNLGKKITLKDVVIQVVEMADERTGEVREAPRVILVDADGTAYHAISTGIFRAVENIIGILGMPNTWENPVPIKVAREGSGNRQYFTIYPA